MPLQQKSVASYVHANEKTSLTTLVLNPSPVTVRCVSVVQSLRTALQIVTALQAIRCLCNQFIGDMKVIP